MAKVILIMRLCRSRAKDCGCVFERVRFRVTALVDVSISVIAGWCHPVRDLNRRSQWAMFFGLAKLTAFVPRLTLAFPFHCSSFSEGYLSVKSMQSTITRNRLPKCSLYHSSVPCLSKIEAFPADSI